LHCLRVSVAATVLKRFVPSFDMHALSDPLFGARAVRQAVTYLVRPEQISALKEAGVWRRAD
jgi:hypothetical protein